MLGLVDSQFVCCRSTGVQDVGPGRGCAHRGHPFGRGAGGRAGPPRAVSEGLAVSGCRCARLRSDGGLVEVMIWMWPVRDVGGGSRLRASRWQRLTGLVGAARAGNAYHARRRSGHLAGAAGPVVHSVRPARSRGQRYRRDWHRARADPFADRANGLHDRGRIRAQAGFEASGGRQGVRTGPDPARQVPFHLGRRRCSISRTTTRT